MEKYQQSHSLVQQHHCKFIKFKIKECYLSLSEETLNKAINFAENHTSISQENIRIIKNCRKSLLFHEDEPWKKKERDCSFEVPMGSYDGVELCELIGIYFQSLLESSLEKDQMGLHREDGLIILCNINKQETDKIQKEIISVFKSIDLEIEITTNLTEVNFLTVQKTIDCESLNSSLKPSVKGYPELFQALKYLNNQNQIMKKPCKKVVKKKNGNTCNQICSKITPEKEHGQSFFSTHLSF